MVLQRDRTTAGHTGKSRVFDNRLSIEHDRELVASHCNNEAIPLADWLVRPDFRCHRRADFRRLLLIFAIAPNLARTDRPTPDIDLAFGAPAQVNAAIARVGHFNHFLRTILVLRVLPAGKDNRNLLQLWLARETPI